MKIHNDRDFYLVIDEANEERFIYKGGVCVVPGTTVRSEIVWKAVKLRLLFEDAIKGGFNRNEREKIRLYYELKDVQWGRHYYRGGNVFENDIRLAHSSYATIPRAVELFGEVGEDEVVIHCFDDVYQLKRIRQFEIITYLQQGSYQEIQEWDSGFSFWLFKDGVPVAFEKEKPHCKRERVEYPSVPAWIKTFLEAGYLPDNESFIHFSV